MTTLRRTLHRHPELSGSEHQTAQTIAAHLEAAGLPWRPLAETGIVCDLPGRHDGPLVALRADTDALPITEETGLPFASQQPGRMHACGHDGHSSILFGAALTLAASPAPGPVRCIWQPAEESAVGAQALIDAGVLDGVDLIFGGHIDPRFPTGHLIVTDGAVSASTDQIQLTVRGQQGHGARPHETRDAIHAGAQLVVALQSIVAREVPPGEPAVVSIGQFHAGSGHNIIAGTALLEGTVRAQDPRLRAALLASIGRIAEGIAHTHRVNIDLRVVPGPPAVINLERAAALARQAAISVVGAEKVGVMPQLNMGGEDFAVYLQHIPGCYIRFGAARPGLPFEPAHSCRFDFDEAAMSAASDWMVAVACAGAQTLLRTL
jgi:amidohydrolase